MIASPFRPICTWKKSPRLRSWLPPRPPVEMSPYLTGWSLTLVTPNDGCFDVALVVTAEKTSQVALSTGSGPHWFLSLWPIVEPYHAMPTRPLVPEVIHGITLFFRLAGETVIGLLQCAAPSRDTDILMEPAPIGVPPFLAEGYSDQVAKRLPTESCAIAGNSCPTS